MISPKYFYQKLNSKGFDFFTGVPDSLLASLCAFIDDNVSSESHLIAANEGGAVGLACGYHMATGKIPVVYMQNSGLGNAVNPLVSIADSLVYKIPILLIIGWRGEPGVADEPQHVKQGAITEDMLEVMDIPSLILGAEDDYDSVIDKSFDLLQQRNSPVALLVKKDTFEPYKTEKTLQNLSEMSREQASECLLAQCGEDIIVSTTGRTSREVYEIRKKAKQQNSDFLTVGGMGHASSIALGAALGAPEKRVVCLDGDGALIMHLGSSAVIGTSKAKNLVHVVLNNAAHESVGGQPTVADKINIRKISSGLGYRAYFEAINIEQIKRSWSEIKNTSGPVFFHVKIGIGSRRDLGRPEDTPQENKLSFMKKFDE